MTKAGKPVKRVLYTSIMAAVTALAGCGGTSGDSSTAYSGNVVAVSSVPNASGNPTLTAGYYAGATVFVDANGNGVLDAGEPSATTDGTGHFRIATTVNGPFVADITTAATNTASGNKVTQHMILRASAQQVADQGAANIVISPMSSEVQRLVEANSSAYAAEKANLATRFSGPTFNLGTATVSGADALSDINKIANAAEKYALMYQANTLANRYAYATAKLDRKDLYPDALAVPGGDPRLSAVSGSLKLTGGVAPVVTPDTRKPITFAQAQQAAFNVEGIPAYDNIFVIVEENQSAGAMLNNTYAPYMNAVLSQFNQMTTYYSTGNPSEPNYTAMGGGDDNGITDDNWWGCGAIGQYALTDVARAAGTASDGQPLPAIALPTAITPTSTLAGYGATSTTCSFNPTGGTVHNVLGDNLFTLLSRAGLTARTYSESMNPGQDARVDSQAETFTSVYQGSYTQDDLLAAAGVTAATASPALTNGVLTGTAAGTAPAAGMYKVKHGPSIAYQAARNLPEFFADNRTIFGSQYQAADWAKSTATIDSTYDRTKWNYDQFTTDLNTGDVGSINFIVPDQCDDMHGVGNDSSCSQNSNTGKAAGTTRADIYLQRVVTAIRNSALWKNPQKRVAIVVVYDEGEGSSTACCGWNPSTTSGAQPQTVVQNADGTYTLTASSPANYKAGNHGHGQSIFGVMTNQQDLGKQNKGVIDTDAYSHFSLVRTLQDMFQIADPTNEATYLNRAKYTEAFILQNINNLPEFAGSADTHFDGVRPMNHAYVIPATYQQKLNLTADFTNKGNTTGATGVTAVQTGPDKTQENLWGPAR